MHIRRWASSAVASLALLIGLASPAAAAPPPNDDISNAVVVSSLPFTTSISTVEATPDPSDPDCVGTGATVWYRLELRRAERVVIDTFGSDYDTTLSAYTGSPGALTQIACNDDSGSLQSQIEIDVERRTVVFIMVGSFASGPGGELTLTATASEVERGQPPATNAVFNRNVTGPFSGSAFFEFGTHGCSFVYQQFDGTVTTPLGTGALHVEGCVDSAPVPGGLLLTGTFSLATADGATYTGEAVGSVFPLELTLDVQSATNARPRQLAGTIVFTASDITGSITGDLVGALKPGRGNQG